MLEIEFHIRYQNEVKDLDLKKSGCLCRSIESITQVPLTEDQKDLRLTQIIEHENARRRLFHLGFTHEVSNSELQQLNETVRNLNMTQINDYIKLLKNQSDTPVGKQLSQMDVKTQNVTNKNIRDLHNDGCRIMIILPGHAMHIEPKSNKTFISLSDGDIEIKLKNKTYPAFIFKIIDQS
jgi:hypothetical protein